MPHLFVEGFSHSGVYYPPGTVHHLQPDVLKAMPQWVAEEVEEDAAVLLENGEIQHGTVSTIDPTGGITTKKSIRTAHRTNLPG